MPVKNPFLGGKRPKSFSPPLQPVDNEELQGSAYLRAEETETADKPIYRQAYIEAYGCQMNFSDTEIIASILSEIGYGFTSAETRMIEKMGVCAIIGVNAID